MAPHWFGGYVSIFSPQGVFGFSYPAVLHLYPVDYCRCCNLERKLFMPATGARPKKTKINLMDCICLMCSGVEITFDHAEANRKSVPQSGCSHTEGSVTK